MEFSKRKVIIVGAGFTGIQLARTLIASGIDVTLIDSDEERVRLSRNVLDCEVVEAEGTSPDVLEDAGATSAMALVALTDVDEVNMVACALVSAAHPDVLTVARVRNDSYYTRAGGEASGFRIPGIDLALNPDVASAEAISSAIAHGAVGNVIELEGGFGIVSVQVGQGSAIDGRRLRDLPAIEGWRSLVAYIESSSGASLPSGDTAIAANDRIGVLCPVADIADIFRLADASNTSPLRRIVLLGAGTVGTLVADRQRPSRRTSFLASFLGKGADDGREVVIVDSDETLCREAAERFNDVRVLCGDMTDPDFIVEERLAECDLLVAASGNLDRNLMISAYMKSRGVRKAIALTESSDFDDVARKLGVDVAVPMRDSVVDAIVSHLRGRSVKAVHTVCNRLFEIVECDVAAGSHAAGKALRDISQHGEYLLLLIRRPDGDSFELPHGDTVVEEGARVALVVKAGDQRVVGLFGGKA